MTPIKITTETVYSYGDISITFRDGEFCSARYPFKGIYSRADWCKLASIEAEITSIEESLKAEEEPSKEVQS